MINPRRAFLKFHLFCDLIQKKIDLWYDIVDLGFGKGTKIHDRFLKVLFPGLLD